MAETKSCLHPIAKGRGNSLVSFSFLCGYGRDFVSLNGKEIGCWQLKIGQRATLKTLRELLTGLRFFLKIFILLQQLSIILGNYLKSGLSPNIVKAILWYSTDSIYRISQIHSKFFLKYFGNT